jgi:alkylation response protein AidB-like acyl-CoA dehydrogenase
MYHLFVLEFICAGEIVMTQQLLNEQELLIRNMVRDFSDSQLATCASQLDETEEFPWENMRAMAELGLLGLTIDEEFGGSGGTTRQLAVAAEEIARGCAATSTVYIAHLSLCTQYINMFGSADQKSKYIPNLVSGEKIGAFALTEPGAGSDAAAIETTSLQTNGHFVINGTKTYISNAPEAGVLVTMVKREKGSGYKGVDALIVDANSGGIEVNKLQGKMGIRASTVGEIVFNNCHVPSGNRMGEDGEGFRQTMEVLNSSRITIAAQCVGIAQSALDVAVSYAKERSSFGKKIGMHQMIQSMIADIGTEVEAARQLVMKAATLRDLNMPFITEASMAKLFASRVAMKSADRAVQIHGGAGYFAPSAAERIFRDARVLEIYEGTSEIQKMVIARNILEG